MRWILRCAVMAMLLLGCLPAGGGNDDEVVAVPPNAASTDGSASDAGPNADDPDLAMVNIGDDRDNDGLGDVAEGVVGTDPGNPDSDGDGVRDGEEFTLGSNPMVADSDEDGLSDGTEVANGTDPARADTDGDGFTDGEEHTLGTDPSDPFSWPFGGQRWPDLRGQAQGVYATGWALNDVLANLEFRDQFGQALWLYQFYGYVILIDFSAGWCGPCRVTAESAQAMWADHRDQGFMIIHLLTEAGRPGDPATPALLTDWAAAYGIEFPVVLQEDGSGYAAFQTSEVYGGSLPFLVLVNREMQIDRAFGAGQEAEIEARIETLLADEAIPRPRFGGPGPNATTEICDQDGDGADNTSCGGRDCRDRDDEVGPDRPELCDEVDRNCDGAIHHQAEDAMDLFLDADGDGYGDPMAPTQACQEYWPYVQNGDDCDDADQNINPDTLWYRDEDGDGAGDPENSITACVQPPGYVSNGQDADDTQASAGCWQTVTVARDHACGLRTDGSIACWGDELGGLLDAPEGNDFVAVSAGYRHTCALRDNGRVVCWGSPANGATTPPNGQFESISCGLGFCCGSTTDEADNLACWGNDEEGQASPPAGHYRQVSTGGGRHACAIDQQDQLRCWGLVDGFRGGDSPTAVPPGTYRRVSAGHYLTCAVTTDGEGRCWGANAHNQANPPDGAYEDLSAGTVHSCGLTTAGAVRCFGSESLDRCASPEGTFVQMEVNQLHSCGVTDTGLVRCWGSADDGRTTPPPCAP